MPQAQLNAFLAVSHQLPVIAKQLRIANELKALEMKIIYKDKTWTTWKSDGQHELQNIESKLAEIMRG